MLIHLQDISYTYMKGGPFEKEALNDINLEINEGEFIGLIGHTGSGKSTLVQHLNGLLKPSHGKIIIDNIEITNKAIKLKQIRNKVGLVFQYPEHQLFEETVYKDIAFGPLNMELSEEEVKERVYKAIEVVGISQQLLERSPFELSGGQKRRVAIAGVLAMEPKILILDEPTAGLDPAGRDDILYKIKQLHEKHNVTVILVSHSMEDVARLVDRILVMDKGRIVMDGRPGDIYKNSKGLENIGLSVPQITKVIGKLKEKGINIKGDIYTIEQAKKELLQLIAEKAGGK